MARRRSPAPETIPAEAPAEAPDEGVESELPSPEKVSEETPAPDHTEEAGPEPPPHESSEPGDEYWDGPGGALRKALWQRGQAVFDQLEKWHQEPTVDVVHDIRVACRRLESALALTTELIGSKPVRKPRKRISRLRNGLAELRDVHIQRAFLEDHLESQPGLQGRVGELHEQEEGLWAQAHRAVRRQKPGKLARRLEEVDALVAALVETSEGWQECLEMLSRAVAHRYTEVVSRAGECETDHSAGLHQLRLAFKKFRYMAELVGQLQTPPISSEALAGMRSLQRALGSLQDLEVITRGLEAHWLEHPPRRAEQVAILQHLLEHRHQEVEHLQQALAALDSFWELPARVD